MKRLYSVFAWMAVLCLLTSCSIVSHKIEEHRLPHLRIETETTAPLRTEPSAAFETTAETMPAPPAGDDVFVRVTDYIPDLVVDLKYATKDNFTGQAIYDSDEAWLRYGTVKKLIAVQHALSEHGLRLKLWDGFRPPAAQMKLWEICPDPTFVSDPNNGFSNHSRGNTVDITLVDSNGNELEMPTGFDDFSALADRDYSDCADVEADNSRLLEQVMQQNGFKGYYGEWWHYTDTDTYEVEQEFIP